MVKYYNITQKLLIKAGWEREIINKKDPRNVTGRPIYYLTRGRVTIKAYRDDKEWIAAAECWTETGLDRLFSSCCSDLFGALSGLSMYRVDVRDGIPRPAKYEHIRHLFSEWALSPAVTP